MGFLAGDLPGYLPVASLLRNPRFLTLAPLAVFRYGENTFPRPPFHGDILIYNKDLISLIISIGIGFLAGDLPGYRHAVIILIFDFDIFISDI